MRDGTDGSWLSQVLGPWCQRPPPPPAGFTTRSCTGNTAGSAGTITQGLSLGKAARPWKLEADPMDHGSEHRALEWGPRLEETEQSDTRRTAPPGRQGLPAELRHLLRAQSPPWLRQRRMEGKMLSWQSIIPEIKGVSAQFQDCGFCHWWKVGWMCQKTILFIFSLWEQLVKNIFFFFFNSPDAWNSSWLELIYSHQKILVTSYLIRYNFTEKLTLN